MDPNPEKIVPSEAAPAGFDCLFAAQNPSLRPIKKTNFTLVVQVSAATKNLSPQRT